MFSPPVSPSFPFCSVCLAGCLSKQPPALILKLYLLTSEAIVGLLGPDLLKVADEEGKHSARNVLVLAAEGVSLLQELHAANFVHRDIKPENLVLGVAGSKAARKLHLIDFGTAESLVDRNGARRTAPQAAEGSLPYMAVSVHNQNALGKRDDVEAFVWTLLRLCLGILPWEVSV